MAKSEHIEQTLARLPQQPGVYQYFDVDRRLLYVGKAKNLKKRVSSYFTKHHDNGKTRLLVSKIHDIQWLIAPSEADALLLENSLIKEHKPFYNIQLKDDKTYPFIVIKKERFPRIFATRQLIRDGSEYFGPFPSVKVMHTVLDLCRKLYPIRTCALALTEENIANGKFRSMPGIPHRQLQRALRGQAVGRSLRRQHRGHPPRLARTLGRSRAHPPKPDGRSCRSLSI